MEKVSEAPPEPPTAPINGRVFEEKDGSFFCRVPGCSKPSKAFDRIAVHLSRLHGLDVDGNAVKPERRRAPAVPPPPVVVDVNVRMILQGTERALIEQGIKVIEVARSNLSGKLADMDTLKAKSAKLERIALCMRELI